MCAWMSASGVEEWDVRGKQRRRERKEEEEAEGGASQESTSEREYEVDA